MKRTIYILALLGTTSLVFGQSIDRMVIGSAGKYTNAQDNSLNFTVGETAVALLGDGPSVAEGFHRASTSIIVSTEAPHEDWAVRIFPNPTQQWLQIELPAEGLFDAHLIAENGQLLWVKPLQAFTNRVDLAPFPAGIYWLTIRNDIGDWQSFKIIKAD